MYPGSQPGGGKMARIQDDRDDRDIGLDRVGVTNLVYPVTIPMRSGGAQTAEARVGLFAALRPEARGAHMSRFVEVFDAHRDPLTPESVERLLRGVRDSLETESAEIEVEFTYFVKKSAPVSGKESLLACTAAIEGSLGQTYEFTLAVRVPVVTVCPCSMEATGGPAHSQRGYVTVAARFHGELWIEELVELVESCASAPIYALLKGDDESSIIESAHENPVLVEDMVRNVAERLDSDVRIFWYRVEAENQESVHDHDVYASVERSH